MLDVVYMIDLMTQMKGSPVIEYARTSLLN